jgi:hypothetical protein
MAIHGDNIIVKSSLRNVVIDCLGTERHFTISGSNVTIEGLLLVNGASSSSTDCAGDLLACSSTLDGGCMLIHGNQTVIRDSSFVNCWAAERGGAISISSPKTVTSLIGVNILQSEATVGGGLWSRGLLSLQNCTLAFNYARLHGGAVFVQGTKAFLLARQTIISSNTAYGGHGGGISMMVRNEAVPDCRDQEQIVPDGGSAILNEVTIVNNWAENNGGAIFLQDGFTLSLEGSGQEMRLEKNVALKGGGIFAFFSQNINIIGNVSFFDNLAFFYGGAMDLRCATTCTITGGDVTFEGNTASNEDQGYGGAILISDRTVVDISGNASFVSNRAEAGYGGAVFVQVDSVFRVSGSVSFVQNQAIGGGAISNCWSGNTDLSGHVQFVDNAGLDGGALNVESGSSANMVGRVSFSGNRGVRVSSAISAITGMSQLVPGNGGAVYVDRASLHCGGEASFENNTADMGGAVFVSTEGDLTVGDSVSFRGCSAASGGALYIQSSTAWFGGETIVEGNAAGNGGGLFVRFECTRFGFASRGAS